MNTPHRYWPRPGSKDGVFNHLASLASRAYHGPDWTSSVSMLQRLGEQRTRWPWPIDASRSAAGPPGTRSADVLYC